MEDIAMARTLVKLDRDETLLNFVSGLMAPEDPVWRKFRLDTPQRGLPAIRGMQDFLRTMADNRFFSSCAMIPTGEGMAVAVMK